MITAIETVQQFLRTVVDVPVVSKVPMNTPEVFVRVTQSPPRRYTPITDRSLVIVQVYGTDLGAVVDLIAEIREHMFSMEQATSTVLGWQEESGPVEFADPDMDCFRWQLTGQLFQALP